MLSAAFGIDMAGVYPDAKLVVLTRDPVESYGIMLGSIRQSAKPASLANALARFQYFTLHLQMQMCGLCNTIGSLSLLFAHGRERDKAIAWLKARYSEFRDGIPAGRRLQHTDQDAWRPLCEHLVVPAPLGYRGYMAWRTRQGRRS